MDARIVTPRRISILGLRAPRRADLPVAVEMSCRPADINSGALSGKSGDETSS
jgi:hypothetical protein